MDVRIDQGPAVTTAVGRIAAQDPRRETEQFRRMQAARTAVDAAELELRDAVRAARGAGNSWTVVGEAVGITRQAACQRFGGD